MNKEKADMIIYTIEDGLTKVETTFDGDTVWLSIDQMAELFQRDRSVIGKHVRNIFKEGELEKRISVGKICLHCYGWKSLRCCINPQILLAIKKYSNYNINTKAGCGG